MNYNRYKKYLVMISPYNEVGVFLPVGKKGGQFFRVGTEFQRRPLAAQSYSLKEARELIKKSYEFRRKKGINDDETKYFLVPFGKPVK